MSDLRKEIIELLNEGNLSRTEIAIKLDCSYSYVFYVKKNMTDVQVKIDGKIKPISKLEIPSLKNLLGMEDTLKKIKICSYGSKPTFIGGFHGLGKSVLVTELAKHDNAELIRLQVTPFLTEYDIIGQPDIHKGFILSKFAQTLLEANKNPSKQYYLLLDEFTRGQQEAFQCLMPVLAERTLFINNPASDINEIKVPENVKIFATGNLHDSGQREIGQAEMDRWNIVEVQPIQKKTMLNNILYKNIDYNIGTMDNLIKFYQVSWKKADEGRSGFGYPAR